jgi:hypothetical protein
MVLSCSLLPRGRPFWVDPGRFALYDVQYQEADKCQVRRRVLTRLTVNESVRKVTSSPRGIYLKRAGILHVLQRPLE